MASDTRQRLIDTARAHFYRDGFRSVGLEPILAEVGISKTAFYKHFASKDDLTLAVLDAADDLYRRQFRQMLREHAGPSAVAQLRAVIDVVERIMNQSEYHGCIFISAAIEFPLPHDPAHQAAARHKRSLEDHFIELAERAQIQDPQSFAQELSLIIEGAYITRSLTDDPATISIARRLATHLLDHHLPLPAR